MDDQRHGRRTHTLSRRQADAVSARKPEPAIYEAFRATVPEHTHCVFVDDRPENVAAAARCGMHGVLFVPRSTVPSPPFTAVASLSAVIGLLNEMTRSPERA